METTKVALWQRTGLLNIMSKNKPLSLNFGDTIGIVATTRWIKPENLEKTKILWEQKGYKVKIHPNNYSRHHEWGGDFEERVTALTDYWNDPEVKAIIPATGGNRTLHLLDHLNFDELSSPKIIMGFSDTTALLNSISHKNNMVTFHGPSANSFSKDTAETHFKETIDLLSGKLVNYNCSSARVLKEGEASGELIGGNLCIFNYMQGTEFIPSLKGKILFFEDEGEELRNIDRMLLNLNRLGKLKDVDGIMVGGFSTVKNDGIIKFPYSLNELLIEHTKNLDIPVVVNAPFSHGKELVPLPIGVKARLTANSDEITLKLLESAVETS